MLSEEVKMILLPPTETRPPEKIKVVVGMSGGVDSAVSALLLKKAGFQVLGFFMKNWDELDPNGDCPAEKEFQDVARVCDQIGIPFTSTEYIAEYREQVFREFLEEFKKGYTPNPDVLCNREIKFEVFLKETLKLGADYLATGHYAQIGWRDGKALLKKAVDGSKDQSYFLQAVGTEALSKVLFPIGDLEKKEVRRIASDAGLAVSKKKDSTGICFIGEQKFRPFLQKYLSPRAGDFLNLDGTWVGRHEGAIFYTLGQRKGLRLGGEGERWYVVAKDVEKNIVYVERGAEHPALYASTLVAENPHWVAGVSPAFPLRLNAKVRYRQEDRPCRVEWAGERLEVTFDSPERAMTPGQFVAFYEGDVCLGGAVIREVKNLAIPESSLGLPRSLPESARQSLSI